MVGHSEPDPGRVAPRGALAWWGLLGLLLSFGIASLPSIGLFVLAAAIVVAVIMVVRRVPLRAMPALLIGAAITPLYIAARNIRGPGMLCDESLSCGELYNPWPFAIIGALLLLVGAMLLLRRAK